MTTTPLIRAARAIGLGAVAATLTLGLASAPASAKDIIASDDGPTTVAAAPASPGPRAAASIPRGIVVTHPDSQPVVVFAKGQPTQRKPRPGNAPATFTGLRAGVTYTVAVGGKVIAHVTAIDKPAAASHLVVTTDASPTSVELTWQHPATIATGGKAIAYDISAVPQSGKALTSTVIGKHAAMLTGLDSRDLYSFTVTPRNTAGKGKPTTATMRRSLAEVTGIVPVAAEPAKPSVPAVPVPPTKPTVTPAETTPAPAPAPGPAPAPAPAPGPSTKTIYVCPDGYTDTGDACQKTTPYTYDVVAYTYHLEDVYGWGQTGWDYSYGYCSGAGNSGNWPNGDPYCQYPVYGNTVVGTKYVRDSTPAGYTDTGSNWTKRSAPPAGYLDDGTQWVKTVSKEARVVPA